MKSWEKGRKDGVLTRQASLGRGGVGGVGGWGRAASPFHTTSEGRGETRGGGRVSFSATKECRALINKRPAYQWSDEGGAGDGGGVGGKWHFKRFHRGEAKKSSLQNGEKVRKKPITDGNVKQKGPREASVQPPKATNKGLQTPVALRRWGGGGVSSDFYRIHEV